MVMAQGDADRDVAAGDFTLEGTERAVAARLGGASLDLASMAVVSNIYRAAHSIRNHLERTVLAPYGLTWTGWVVLWVVWIWGEPEAGVVAGEAGISRSTLTGVARTLETKGLVHRSAHPDDGRRVVLSLTDDGETLMAQAFQEFNSVEKWATSHLETEAEAEVAHALRAIINRVESARPCQQSARG